MWADWQASREASRWLDKKAGKNPCKQLVSRQVGGWVVAWTNFSLQDKPWAEFSTLEVAACIPCTYCLV